MELWDIIRFQLVLYSYLKKISLTEQNFDCLTLLAMSGDVEIGEFCNNLADNKIFKNAQSARTSLQFLEEKELITTDKKPKAKKRVKLNDAIVVQSNGNILMNIKILRVEAAQ